MTESEHDLQQLLDNFYMETKKYNMEIPKEETKSMVATKLHRATVVLIESRR